MINHFLNVIFITETLLYTVSRSLEFLCFCQIRSIPCLYVIYFFLSSPFYRGHWHGEVLIHTRTNAENLEHFLDEVAMLSMVRHENVALFMGACIDEPHLAIITR